MSEILETKPILKVVDKNAEGEGRATASKNENIERYFSLKYDFHFNVITGQPEYRSLGENASFVPVDDYTLNTFKRELDANGLSTSPDNIYQILGSSYAEKVNPIQSYFEKLPKWNKHTDYIEALCKSVTSQDSDLLRG